MKHAEGCRDGTTPASRLCADLGGSGTSAGRGIWGSGRGLASARARPWPRRGRDDPAMPAANVARPAPAWVWTGAGSARLRSARGAEARRGHRPARCGRVPATPVAGPDVARTSASARTALCAARPRSKLGRAPVWMARRRPVTSAAVVGPRRGKADPGVSLSACADLPGSSTSMAGRGGRGRSIATPPPARIAMVPRRAHGRLAAGGLEPWRRLQDRRQPALHGGSGHGPDVHLADVVPRVAPGAGGKDPETLSPRLQENPFANAFDSATEATLQRSHRGAQGDAFGRPRAGPRPGAVAGHGHGELWPGSGRHRRSRIPRRCHGWPSRSQPVTGPSAVCRDRRHRE